MHHPPCQVTKTSRPHLNSTSPILDSLRPTTKIRSVNLSIADSIPEMKSTLQPPCGCGYVQTLLWNVLHRPAINEHKENACQEIECFQIKYENQVLQNIMQAQSHPLKVEFLKFSVPTLRRSSKTIFSYILASCRLQIPHPATATILIPQIERWETTGGDFRVSFLH